MAVTPQVISICIASEGPCPRMSVRISPGREAIRPIALVASDDEVGLFSLGHSHAAFIPACAYVRECDGCGYGGGGGGGEQIY